MARVPLVDHHDPAADPKAASLLAMAESAQPGVPVLNVHRALANHPDLMEAMMGMASVAYFNNSLNLRQRELPYLTSAITIGCFY